MNKKVFPQLGEQYFEQRMENGMMVRVVEKPGFAKKYAFVAVNFGSIDTKFRLNGVDYATPDGGQRDGAVRAECWQQQRLYELCDDGLLRRVYGAF